MRKQALITGLFLLIFLSVISSIARAEAPKEPVAKPEEASAPKAAVTGPAALPAYGGTLKLRSDAPDFREMAKAESKRAPFGRS